MTNDELTRLFPLVRTGDERACEQLWNGMNIPVYTVALRILDDKYLAEDVTQEVFVKLFRDPPGGEVRNPRAWIFRITHNAALNCLERQRVRASDELDESTAPVTSDDCDTRLDIARRCQGSDARSARSSLCARSPVRAFARYPRLSGFRSERSISNTVRLSPHCAICCPDAQREENHHEKDNMHAACVDNGAFGDMLCSIGG